MHYLLLLSEAPTATTTHDDDADDLATPTVAREAAHDRVAPDAHDGVGPAADAGTVDPADDWGAYTLALSRAGVLVSGSALQGVDTATSVRVRGGRRLLTDGPFAETKEHLLGFYVIDVPDLDVALDWAARVPCVRTGTVEVRPLLPGSDTATTLAAMAAEPA